MTLRLWLPQLFKMMSESVDKQNKSMCEMISSKNNDSFSRSIFTNSTYCTPVRNYD